MELPGKDGLSAILERAARLLARTGRELGERPLVLPNGTFFPDRFTRDQVGVETLALRMADHAGLGDVPLTVALVHEEGPEAPHPGGCATGCLVPGAVAGTVPRLVDDGDGFTLNVPAFELGHPVVLGTMMARALGHVFLVEALPAGARIEPPVDLTADYAAAALGLGPLLLEGAHVYSKGCGGPSVSSVTRASLPELAVLTAFFAEMRGQPVRRALAELSTTQRALLSDAHALAKSNATLVRLLREDPERVARGDYALSEEVPWLVRLFRKKDARTDADRAEDARANADADRAEARGLAAAPAKSRREQAPEEAAARDELRALVDEAFLAAQPSRDAE